MDKYKAIYGTIFRGPIIFFLPFLMAVAVFLLAFRIYHLRKNRDLDRTAHEHLVDLAHCRLPWRLPLALLSLDWGNKCSHNKITDTFAQRKITNWSDRTERTVDLSQSAYVITIIQVRRIRISLDTSPLLVCAHCSTIIPFIFPFSWWIEKGKRRSRGDRATITTTPGSASSMDTHSTRKPYKLPPHAHSGFFQSNLIRFNDTEFYCYRLAK